MVGHVRLIAGFATGVLLLSTLLAPVTFDLDTRSPPSSTNPTTNPASTSYAFQYTINATSVSDANWTASETGSGSVSGADRDKLIVNSTLTAPANDTIYRVTIVVNSSSFTGDTGSDYGIAKSPTVWAWMVGRGLHAGSVDARDNLDHSFAYRIVASGTQDVPLQFNYTINATGRERYSRMLYLNESIDYSWRQHFERRHETVQACLSNTSFTLVSYQLVSLNSYGFVHSGEQLFPPERPYCVKFTAHVNGAGFHSKHHYRLHVELYGEFNDTNAQRDWHNLQTGSGNLRASESPKFIANYTGQIGTGLQGAVVLQMYTRYIVSVDNPLVVATMDGNGNLRVIANHTAPWSSSLLGSSFVNATESVKTIDTSTAVAPNNITSYSTQINVTGTLTTSYVDRNGDGTIEAGLFYAWLNDPGGNVLYASVTLRPPVAVIDSISPTLSQEGDVVTLYGHGVDPTGGNITNITWRSHADGTLSSNSSFNTSGLSARTHLISLMVKNGGGLWSPPATSVIRVNQKPTAVVAAAAGTGVDSNSRRVAAIGENITFIGYGFDADGHVAAYEWTSSMDGALSNSSVFSNSSLSLGKHTVHLRVRDNDGAYSEAANITITIRRHPVILIHGYLSTPSVWHRMEERLAGAGFETFTLDLRRPTDVRGKFTLSLNNANYTPNQDFMFYAHIIDLKLFDISVPLPLPEYLQTVATFVAKLINGNILTADGVEISLPRLAIPYSMEDYFDAEVGLTLKLKKFRLAADPFSIKATLHLGIDVAFNVSVELGLNPAHRLIDLGTLKIESGPISGSIKIGVTDLLSSTPRIGLVLNLGFPLFRLNLANADIKSYSQDLADLIKEVQERTGISRVDVVGHDMGGLVARWYGLVTVDNPIRKLVLLGVPNHGFSGAKYLPILIKALITWITGYIPVVGVIIGQILNEAFTYVLGDAIKMMIPHSSFLRALNGNNKDGTKCVSVGGGACDYLDLGGTDHIPWSTEHYVIRGDFGGPTTISHYHVCVDYYVKVSCYEVPWLEKGDLMVTLDSAKLDNVLRDTVPIWHFWLPYSESVFHKVRDFLFDDPPAVMPESDNIIVYNSMPVLEATELLPGFNGSVAPSEVKSHDFSIEPASLNFSLAVSAEAGDINVTMVDPDSNVITPSSANNVTINYTKADGVVSYEIQNPTTGQWTAQVTGSNGSGGPTNYTGFGRFNTNIILSVDLENVTHKPGSAVPIRAMFRDGANPATGASVVTSVMNPAKEMTNLTLYDDGAHGDLNASDGVYGNVFTATSLEGAYHLNVTGSYVKAGATVTRRSPADFIVERRPDLEIRESGISFSPEEPTHGECVEMSAQIRNTGDGDASGVDVRFFDGRPDLGGSLISSARIFVPVGAVADAYVPWCAIEGDHEIFVQIDPSGDYVESNYSNNNASRMIFVSGSPPLADAGRDITSTSGAPVFFDGTASTDDSGIVNYSWDTDLSVDSDADGVLYNDLNLFGPKPVLSSGYPATGIYLAGLSVIDSAGNRGYDVLVIRIVEELDTTPPMADAGHDIVVGTGREVRLDASGSVDDYGISSYEWDLDVAVDSDGDGIGDNDQDFVGRAVVLREGYRVPGAYAANLTVNDAAGNGPVKDSVTIVVVDGNVSVPCDLDTKGGLLHAINDLCQLRNSASIRGDNKTVYAVDTAIDRLLRSAAVREVENVSVTPSSGVSVKMLTSSRLTLEIPWGGTQPDNLILRFQNSTQDILIPFRDVPQKPYLLFPNGPFDGPDGRQRAVEPAGALRDDELWVPIQGLCYWERNLFRIHDYGETWHLMKLDIRFYDVSRDFEVWIDGYLAARVDIDFRLRDRFVTSNKLSEELGEGAFQNMAEAARAIMDVLEVRCEGVASLFIDLNLTVNASFIVLVYDGGQLLFQYSNVSIGSGDSFLLNGSALPGGKLPNPIHIKILMAGGHGIYENHIVHTTCSLAPSTQMGSLEIAEVTYLLVGGLPPDEATSAEAFLDRLLKSAERLSQLALAEAQQTQVNNSTNLEQVHNLTAFAEEALAKAYEESALTRYDKAIEMFGRAWRFAVESRRLALQ